MRYDVSSISAGKVGHHMARLNAKNLSPVVRGAIYYFAFWGVVGVYIPFMFVHFKQIGLTGTQIGLFATFMPLMMLTTAPIVANLADRWRVRTRVLACSIALLGISLALLGSTNEFWLLLPFMLFMAFVRSPIAGIGDGLVAKMAVTHGVNFGSMRLWGSFGFAAIAAISGIFWQRYGYQPMFLIACIGFCAMAALALLLDEEAAAPQQKGSWGPLLQDPALRTIMITAFLMAGSLAMSGTFEGIMMDYLGGGGIFIGLLLGFTGISEIPLMRNAPRLADRFGAERTFMIGCLIIALAHVAYATAWSPVVLLGGATIRGAGFGLSFVMMVTIVARRSPPGMAASSQAVVSAAGWGLAPLIGIPISGVLYDLTGGPQVVFWVCVVMAVAAAMVMGHGIIRGVFRS
jgi:MFS transporter, PPP family, 3-phenylpropionic acid transporter